jgi:hypothetical protein
MQLRHSREMSRARSEAVPVNMRTISVDPTRHHSVRGTGFCCNSSHGAQASLRRAGHTPQPVACYTDAFHLPFMNGKFPMN